MLVKPWILHWGKKSLKSNAIDFVLLHPCEVAHHREKVITGVSVEGLAVRELNLSWA